MSNCRIRWKPTEFGLTWGYTAAGDTILLKEELDPDENVTQGWICTIRPETGDSTTLRVAGRAEQIPAARTEIMRLAQDHCSRIHDRAFRLAEEADRENQALLNGDDALGIYGKYPPVDLDTI